ncbi:MAG: hypothetical protein P8I03_11520 [Thalassotalea sp.]|uniref:hypothetical protein n=1 Tax=uncultured Paraglaciecola sp. TaxID=1765024 RepID=UPI00261C9244|nr:hypothetical protein [uncultured Paraglaciecola sp.]MDG1752272.1 hypothetical protein [Thalassotalea sp.]
MLDIQYQGDKAASDEFIAQYTHWDESLHQVLANKMHQAKQPLYRLVKYQALGE